MTTAIVVVFYVAGATFFMGLTSNGEFLRQSIKLPTRIVLALIWPLLVLVALG